MPSYVYILINPSMKGLLKIGMTNRSPEDRALELSGSTNMPTPFSVAYDEIVPDGYLAEKIIHEELARKGFRVSDSREFFSIPLKTAIQVVSQVAEQLRNESGLDVSPAESGDENLGEFYFLKGLKELNGSHDTLQDHKAAYASFTNAANFNVVESYFYLSHMHILGLGVPQSADAALSYLKKGGDKGDISCYKTMWDIYAGNTVLDVRNDKNAEVCFSWMIDAAENGVENAENVLIGSFHEYLDYCYDRLGEHGKKFQVSDFPGDHFNFVFNECIERFKRALQKVREARIYKISREELDEQYRNDAAIPSGAEAIVFEYFLTDCVIGSKDILKQCLVGIEPVDLEYFFQRAKNPAECIARYGNYLTNARPVQIQEEAVANPSKKLGFWARIFS